VWNQIHAILVERDATAKREAEAARVAQSKAAKAAHAAAQPTAQHARVGEALEKQAESKRSAAPLTASEAVKAAKARKKAKGTSTKGKSHFFQNWTPKDTIFFDQNSHEDLATNAFYTTGYGAWPTLDKDRPMHLVPHPDGPKPYSRSPRGLHDNAILNTAHACVLRINPAPSTQHVAHAATQVVGRKDAQAHPPVSARKSQER
jgi:hypothetical protein